MRRGRRGFLLQRWRLGGCFGRRCSGLTKDRDPASLFRALAPAIDHFVATTIPSPRSHDPAELAAGLAPLGPPVTHQTAPPDALLSATERAGPDGLVVVLGSLYLIEPCAPRAPQRED